MSREPRFDSLLIFWSRLVTYFKQAFRSLSKSPFITVVAVLSLALGIGANAAIFSLFEQLLMRPMAVQEPSRLVNLTDRGPKSGSVSNNTAGDLDSVFSYPMFRDLEAAESRFSGVAGHRAFSANLAFQGDTRSSTGMLVSGGYFDVLGLRPHVGRLIQTSDDEHIGAHPVVVLAHAYWQRNFGADPDVVDKTLVVNGKPLTIIGVAPEGFRGTSLGILPDIFTPVTMRAEVVPGWQGFDRRRSYWLYAFARLEPGVGLDEAEQAINATYRRIILDVEVPLQNGMSESSLARFKDKEITLVAGDRGQSSMHEFVRTPLLMLFGVTGFVLLIACANLVNLLLIRAAQRTGEIAVRMSIGARRYQVVAQLLAESFLLAAIGAAVGMVVARVTLFGLGRMMPADADLALGLGMGPRMWLFAGVLAAVIGLVGLFPALHVSRQSYATALKAQSGRSGSSRGANRFRAAMATLQITLSMVLLIGAGLMIKSLVNVSRVDLGLDIERIVALSVSPTLNGYTDEQCRDFFLRLEQDLAVLPGVDGAAASVVPLISGNNWGSNVSVQGFDAEPDTDTHSNYSQIGPGFFKTMGIDILAGREFLASDTLESGGVVVVNQAFAEKFELGDEVVGKWMQVGSGGENDLQIVGLARDSKYSEVKDDIPPVFYLPYRQDESVGSMTFYVRTAMEPGSLIPTLRDTVRRIDPELPIDDLRTMSVVVEDNIFLDRMLSSLSSAFALLATLLASIGLYGVLAYSVVQRHREIGLRMALGADAGRVRRWVLKQVLAMVAVGAVLGIFIAFNVAHLGEAILYDLTGKDPYVFGGAVVTLALVALLAGFLPAHRAARTNPIEALRDD